jgi:hypothetical protein
VSAADWRWFGSPGHLIVAFDCRFHLCTLVAGGKYLVSTVGEYFPDAPIREVFAQSRGVTLEGRGDERVYDYRRKVGFEDIGSGRKYETMVFKAGKPCDAEGCKCGMPRIDGNELVCEGYNDPASATAGHMKLCRKWEGKKK